MSTTNSPQFSLSQLAHFNRCLFPATLEQSLLAQGVDQGLAFMITSWYKRNVHVGIVGVYQEWATNDPELQQALNEIVSDFVGKSYTQEPETSVSPF